jgi:histidyl-tRNA synthetase
LSRVEENARRLAGLYDVREIRLPILERIDLFQRSTGETSDIVEKQMYTFVDRDEAQTTVVLRPEGTPGVVRAYIEGGYDKSDPEQRFFYSGPMFRRERPQKGRYRQFHQFGVEVFGRADPACDAELLIMIEHLRRDLQRSISESNVFWGETPNNQFELSFRFEINSIGCLNCRPKFRDAVLNFGIQHFQQLCADCKRRLSQNPLRILDCKTDAQLLADAPKSVDYLCEDCRKHFASVKELIALAGVSFFENPRLVRGLDYYTRTTFEILSDSVGSQNAVIAGGRYDGLVKTLGGTDVPGIGFAIGLERLALALEAAWPNLGTEIAGDEALRALALAPQVAMIAQGENATKKAVQLATKMRQEGLRVDLLSPERGLKVLLRRADKIGASYAVIIGDEELNRSVVILRDLGQSMQREVALHEIAAELGHLSS